MTLVSFFEESERERKRWAILSVIMMVCLLANTSHIYLVSRLNLSFYPCLFSPFFAFLLAFVFWGPSSVCNFIQIIFFPDSCAFFKV